VIELSEDTPQQTVAKLTAEANARVIALCKQAYNKGINEGYAIGFKHGVDAVNSTKVEPSEVLYNKPV
jgi:hypothetical protein